MEYIGGAIPHPSDSSSCWSDQLMPGIQMRLHFTAGCGSWCVQVGSCPVLVPSLSLSLVYSGHWVTSGLTWKTLLLLLLLFFSSLPLLFSHHLFFSSYTNASRPQEFLSNWSPAIFLTFLRIRAWIWSKYIICIDPPKTWKNYGGWNGGGMED